MRNEVVLLGLTEAAKKLKMSVSHLRALCDRGALPSIRDSAMRRLFLLQDVAAFKAAREQAKHEKTSGKLRLKSIGKA